MATQMVEERGQTVAGGGDGAADYREGDQGKSATVVGLTKELSDRGVITVVKRNGMIVPFRRDRIQTAIEGAFREVEGISKASPLPQSIHTAVHDVTNRVVDTLIGQALAGSSLTVEGIQDVVEVKLMEAGHYDVARAYIVYRDKHKELRKDSVENIKVKRRDGKVVRFKPIKIASAIERAFRASLAIEGQTPPEVISAVNVITNKVVAQSVVLVQRGEDLDIERIQDEVERQLMSEQFYRVAKDYILYRAERAKARGLAVEEEATELAPIQEEPPVGQVFHVRSPDGQPVRLTEATLRTRIEHACQDLGDKVSAQAVYTDSVRNFYESIRTDEIDTANIMAARARIEREPAYSFVAARLLLDVIYREVLNTSAESKDLVTQHRQQFRQKLEEGVAFERVNPELLEFDLDKLSAALDVRRDLAFQYLGLQTLYDRYLLHEKERRIETPQYFWMRVAMGLALREGERKNERAIEFYDVLSQFLFVSSTPTLFNSGTLHSQMSSCYLSTVMDDLQHIFKCVADDAQLSKWAGGLGNDWTNVRATGARIKGTNGKSQGVIPFLKVANDTAVAVNQGGKRKGAMCAYLETWHLDIEDFLELRKNTGDERRRTHDMNTANWIPDLFMKRVVENGQWTLFSPSDVPDLHDLYGKTFEDRYKEYEALVDKGEITLFKRIEAVSLWRKMLSMLFETGHPWITFKDPSNIRSPQDHVGVVHSSNLCTEILLNTSVDEVAVCNLGSINLAAHTTEAGLDEKLLRSTITAAVRMLDNVIDLNFYPIAEARNSNLKHRPIGLGLMGFQDALYIRKIPYASAEAVEFADTSMEFISYYSILASTELAKERGAYESYQGSKWSKGLLPLDTLKLLKEDRGSAFLEVEASAKLDWSKVREAIKRYGMRNSNTMAIAPTATISNISGVTQSIEPTYKNLYAKSNLSGEFLIHNIYLVEELKARGLWDEEMIDDLKYFDGSILEIERIPEDMKKLFLTAFELEPEWLIECASRRQKWIDMGQSLNLYIAEPSGKKLHDMYFLAWRRGLKTTYYLRSQGATQIEKSTTDINRRGLQPRWMKSKSASANVKVEREAGAEQVDKEQKEVAVPVVCGLDGDCESCQ
jgi:ribonucleoside-diphosphate reductase alpha chain